MKRVLTASQMKQCDSHTIEKMGVPSRELMGRAADAAFGEIMNGGFDLSKVLCVCGTGNNGGDGLAVAMLLSKAGINVEFFVCGDVCRMTEECNYRYQVLKSYGITEQSSLALDEVTLVVDAILGIGLSGNVRGEAADVISRINASGITVVSLDIPSGINSDSGEVMGCAVSADLTVAFARLKPGHILYPGRTHSGKTVVAEIGIGEDGISDGSFDIRLPRDCDISDMIPKRLPDSHKGTYGRLLIAAGSVGMCGASYLSALGAYRSGAGLVEIFAPRENTTILQTLIPEAIITGWEGDPTALFRDRLEIADACVIGPGLGKSDEASQLVKIALEWDKPLLVDADGLNIIAANDEFRALLKNRNAPTVITPHLGEMSRLCGKHIGDIIRCPIRTAMDFARDYGVICVQKNSTTVISDGKTAILNPTGSSALAKGGSGDVLSGIIGAFLASNTDALRAAVCGAYINGKAGEYAAKELSEYSVLASDTANCIGKVILSIK